MKRTSLRTQVALACAGVSAIVTIVATIVSGYVAAAAERDAIEGRLHRISATVDGPLVAAALTRIGDAMPGARVGDSLLADGTFVIIDDQAGSTATFGAVPAGMELTVEAGTSVVSTAEGRMLVVTTDLSSRFATEARLHVGAPLEDVRAAAQRARVRVLGIGVGTTALATLLGWLAAVRMTSPLVALKETAHRIASGTDPSARAPTDGPSELGQLAASLNQMLDELDRQRATTVEALEAARSFSASVAHELRTPLTGIRADLDVLDRNPNLDDDERREILQAILGQHERVTSTMTGLEQLAQSDLGSATPLEIVDLADIADAVVQEAQRQHPKASITLDVRTAHTGCLGSADGLRLLLLNLVTNAAIHGQRDDSGSVRIIVALEAGSAEAISIVVDDDGHGIEPAHRDEAVHRFWTAGPSAGTGLGLAIAAQQATLHGGVLTISDAPSGGCRVSVSIPTAESSH